MEIAPMALLVVVLVVVAFVATAHARKQWRAALQTAAARLGLEYNAGGTFRGATAAGDVGGHTVTLDSFTRSTGKSSQTYTRIRVLFDGYTPFSELRREGVLSSVKKAFVGEDLVTGDAPFDHAVVVRGNEARVLAHLDHETRALVSEAIELGAVLKDGELYWERRGLLKDADALENNARLLLATAGRLGADVEPAERLLHNAMNDPVAGVRDRNLEILLAQYVGSPEAAEAARVVRPDHDPALQVMAARALGVPGIPRLRELALRQGLPAEARRLALQALVSRHGDSPMTVETLVEVTEREGDSVLAAALEGLHTLAARPRVEAVAKETEHPDPAARREVAFWLGELGGDHARAALAAMVAREDDDTETFVAAIRGLGKAGDRLGVEPLLPLTKGLLVSGEVKRAAREAVAAIQSRLGSAEAGRLSVVGPGDGGALSLSAEAGGLAVAEGHADTAEDGESVEVAASAEHE